jgi:hypothetical protein
VSYSKAGAPSKRRALLTSSLGRLRTASGGDWERGVSREPSCENRMYLAPFLGSVQGAISVGSDDIIASYTIDASFALAYGCPALAPPPARRAPLQSDADILSSYTFSLALPCEAAGQEVVLVSSSATHSCLNNCGISNIL